MTPSGPSALPGPARPRRLPRLPLAPLLLPALVLAAGLGLTWTLWKHERQTARNELRAQFDFALRESVSRVEQRMAGYEKMLLGVRGLFGASGALDRDNFHQYVGALGLDANFAGVMSIGAHAWLTDGRAAAAAALPATPRFGPAGGAATPPGGAAQSAPIVLREPGADAGVERVLLDFDAWAEPVRREAMARARDSGKAALSGKLRLAVDAAGVAPAGFAMYLPIYAPGQPVANVAERRASLVGWVYAAFRMRDMMATLYGEQPPGLALAVYDGIGQADGSRMYPPGELAVAPPSATLAANEYLVVGGHTWMLSLSALDDFHARFDRSAAALIAGAGAGLSLLLALLAWLVATGRSRALRLAAAMTVELRASEEKFRAIADCTVNWEVWWGLDGRPRWINPSVRDYTGYTVDECMAMDDFVGTLVYPDDAERVAPEFLKGRRGERGHDLEFRCVRKDGSLFWLSVSWVPISDAKGALTGFRTSGRDITERKLAESELRIAAAAFDSREGMMITDANSVILRVNWAFTETTGYSDAEVVGRTPRLLQSDRHDAAFYRDMWAAIGRNGGWQGEIWGRRKNGETYPKWLTISAVRGADGAVTNYISTHHDITERKKAEKKIEELAFFDALTQLPNRTLLLDRLKQSMTAGSRNAHHGAVLFIDLDHFKTLNDTLGHDQGDLLLQQVARRLEGCLRGGDTVARLGGDEFVVVLESLGPNAAEAAGQTEALGEKILAALNKPYQLGAVEHRSTASVGATLFHGHDTSIDELLKQADLAMYQSKETGRNALRFFDPGMQTVVMERAALEAGLREAIRANQFVLHYQAQVVGDGRVTGAEALVRWQHPQRGMVAPAAFIGLAEDTGLILPLGLWVLRSACAQLAAWAAQPLMAHLTLAVNVSARQFREPDFVATVLAALAESGANPIRLKLELTESLLVDNVQDVIEKMHALKAKGVGFALDDFGTGYSSFSYLRRLPLDQLKIDQSFVRDVLVDPNDAAIARTIVALAQSLGLGVIAEGVETQTQRDFLAGSGCHAYQGYYFSRPLPLAAFEHYATTAKAAA
ncbi:EAL domain-containing protein [Janthinobacterium sp. CG_S6]|uniref:bifunctional diguanylate cyclase/phosphodiesterase n=1 Tax=unclassified Janthinobacterium TaxID=2610881 RepID=UPI00034C68A7|nr:diguanylate cyclase (GGDEF)-like protein/PAS domain S-box-containing protein [Janthinobacterium sp. CG_S6]